MVVKRRNGGETAELFYLERDNLMAVDIQFHGDAVTAGIPRRLFRVPGSRTNRYVASSDGKRFLVLVPQDQEPPPPEVVVNWPALLKKK